MNTPGTRTARKLHTNAAATVALMLVLGFAARSHSQAPASPAVKSPAATLTEIKTANVDLLKQQQATLKRLATLQQQADEMRIFASQH